MHITQTSDMASSTPSSPRGSVSAPPTRPELDLDVFLGDRALFHQPMRYSLDGGATWREVPATAADIRVCNTSLSALQEGGFHLQRYGPERFRFTRLSIFLFEGRHWITVKELDVVVDRKGKLATSGPCHDLVGGYRLLDIRAHSDTAVDALCDITGMRPPS